eukprot:TRINITY_DN185_c0_g1_i1.p1 TRINITY_DN185_c0_g1~~TRINITY_DN185_c0_g1_i1.p1  ORF type:complete len:865 (+),score=224.50 TRINITY_DN185_c0_g1_i1:9195-11789(+)
MALHSQTELPPEAAAVLDRLRSRIRRYVLLEGLALVVAVMGALFWGSFLIDWAYFQMSRLELPRWFRATILIAGIGLVAFGLVAWVALRLLRSLRSRALALVLERRFPELDDRLITAVEAAESPDANNSAITTAMLRQTVVDAARTAGTLDLGGVFDSRPIRRAILIASVLVASILGLAVTNTAAMERWIAGYLNLKDGYWPRETELVVRVISQPGDHLRDFVNGNYKHAKGTDLTLQIDVPAGKKSPERVRLDARLADGRGFIRVQLTRIGDEPFRHTLPGLLDDADLWVTGGDFTSPSAYHVQVVQPPDVSQIMLNCLFPEYTGLNQRSGGQVVRTRQQVNGAQTSLPLATDFVIDVTANKPLHRIRIEGDAGPERWEIALTAPEATGTTSTSADSTPAASISLKSQDGRPEIRVPWPDAMQTAIWSGGHDVVALPFVLAADGAAALPELLRTSAENGKPLAFPLPFPPDSAIRIVLEDSDGIVSITPARFTINGIVDQPPNVATALRGIGSSITRKARIPVTGTLTDDYGVVSGRFDYRIDDGQVLMPRELQTSPDGAREFELHRSETEAFERFDVLPLDLSIGRKLTLSVSALDGCTVAEAKRAATTKVATKSETEAEPAAAPAALSNSELPAHRASGMKYVFTIVSEEELLSMLYAREINIRKRFEQIIVELKQARQELKVQREKADEAAKLKKAGTRPDAETLTVLTQGLAACADRSLHAIRKNSVETAGVETSFVDIREELVNNAADTPIMLERLDNRIIGSLRRINENSFPSTDSALGLFKLAVDKDGDPTGPMDEAMDHLDSIIESMEQILSEMRELAKFHEVVEQLKANIKAQQDLLEETKRKRKENAIKGLLE